MTEKQKVVEKIYRFIVSKSIEKELTKCEKRILRFVIQGYSNNAIADKICVHVKTVKFHKSNIYKKISHLKGKGCIAEKNAITKALFNFILHNEEAYLPSGASH